jgi:parallel beta-helix repeat protein
MLLCFYQQEDLACDRFSQSLPQRIAGRYRVLKGALLLALAVTVGAAAAFAKQGVVRTLYTVPNTTFIEQPTGESVVTINDTSGSISSLQTAIDNARSANPGNVIVIHLQRGGIYFVTSAGIVLGSHECLVAEGAIIQAANSSVTVPLITIASGSTNVSVAGGTLDGQGANTQGIFAPSAKRVNIDKVIVRNFASDGILLNGNGNSTFDNEMTVTRSDVSGNGGAGIHIQNSTQTTVLDNNCHDNATGIQLSTAWANIANNTCHNNTTGIDVAGGNDNVVANNTCDNNGTGIHAGGSKGMIVSNALGNNTTAGISSTGTSNNFIDNLFTAGNATNFVSGGTTDNIVAYKSPVSASGQNYFYPPLIDNQHSDTTIVNGMGRTDLTIASTTIDDVQNQYNAAIAANPGNVIVLHLNGTFTVGANSLKLSSNTSVLLTGTIQVNAATTASAAVTTSATGQTRISISGGVIDGGGRTGKNGISIASASMVQIDNMTLQNFGPSNPRVGNSDVIHLSGGSTPYVVTRNFVNGGAARGIWLQLSGQKSLISDNEVTNVNEDGVDCDSSTFGAVVKFNYCHDLVRYGVFIEQSAKNNLALGNICNNDGRDINLFNNDVNPRAPVQFNSIISNSLLGSNGIRNGSTGNAATVTSHNFFFDNTVINASIQSQAVGTENYYSQNYQVNGTLSTAGVETFFNSADVSGNLQIRDSNSGLTLIVQGASTADGAAAVTAQPSPLGNGSNDDEWQFIPTNNGYYRVVNANSGLVMAVQGASPSDGAPIIQTAYTADATFNDEWLIQPTDNGLYNFVDRLSALYLDVPGASTTAGTQLDQSPSNGGANQQFSLVEDTPPPDFTLSATPASQTVVDGGSTSYTVTVTASNGFGETVTLDVSGLPGGATATFTPPTINGAGSSTLAITNAFPPGNYSRSPVPAAV